MENEFQKMQRLAGVPVTKDKKQLDENFVGLPMVGNIFDRPKADYELAYEHYLGKLNENGVEEVEGNEMVDFVKQNFDTIKTNFLKSETDIIKDTAEDEEDEQSLLDYLNDSLSKATDASSLIDVINERSIGVDLSDPEQAEELFDEIKIYTSLEEGMEDENPIDSITMDVPLFIRMLEFAREDASTDMDLHDVAEKAIAMSAEGGVLSMDNYEDLVDGETEVEA
jgi:hypothetical protein